MAEPEVELMPAQRVPRSREEAYWRKQLAAAYPRRHAGPMHRRWARLCVGQLRDRRASTERTRDHGP